jgi:hypothetical protein
MLTVSASSGAIESLKDAHAVNQQARAPPSGEATIKEDTKGIECLPRPGPRDLLAAAGGASNSDGNQECEHSEGSSQQPQKTRSRRLFSDLDELMLARKKAIALLQLSEQQQEFHTTHRVKKEPRKSLFCGLDRPHSPGG